MSDVSLGFDTRSVVTDTNKTVSALDTLIAVLERLERRSDSYTRKSGSDVNQALARIRTLSKDLEEVYNQVQSAAEGGTRRGPQLIAEQNKAIQSLYEARLASQVALGSEELAFWKQHGVALGGLQKKQLADSAAMLKANADLLKSKAAAATPMNLDETRLLLGLPSRDSMKSFAAQLKSQMSDDMQTTKLKAAAATPMNLDETRLLLGLPSRDSMKSFAAQLKSQMSDDMQTTKLKAAAATPMNLDETRLLLGLPSRDSMKSFAAQLKSQMSDDMQTTKLKAAAATPMNLDETRLLLGLPSRDSMKSFAAQLKTEMQELQKAQAAATRVQIPLDTVTGAFTPYDAAKRQASELRREQAALAASNGKVSDSFKKLASDGNDVHSMARGLASGFGALWLTWGNLAPLFIGAGISNGFMQTAKAGMATAHTMEIIAQVGGNTRSEMLALNVELDRLSKSGPVGPQQVANAMKTLSLAGLKANEILAVTGDVLNFSVAGTTSLETAASTLMTVSTAFGLGAAGFSRVADVISKAAAESMTSVENFSSAMKTASVINAQYGVSLEDTATAIAAMSQLGIEGTSAGTALRNMYADLSGRSLQVSKVLKSQGIEMRDTVTGGFKPMIQVVSELNTKFQSLSAIGQKNLLQSILSERGAKGIVELLRLINSEAKDSGAGFANALVEMQSKISDSAGFAAVTAAKLGQTVDSQFKAVQATLQSSMMEAYREMEPTLALIARDLKAAFASEEFKAGLTTLVTFVAEFTRVLVENSKIITTLAVTYAALKVAQMGMLAVTGLISTATQLRTAHTVAETVAIQANTAAQSINNTTKVGAVSGVVGLARAIPYVGQALAVGTTAWLAWDYYMGQSNRTAEKADALYSSSIVKNLTDHAEKLERLNALMREGLSLQDAEIKLRGQQPNEDTSRSRREAQAEVDRAKAKLDAVDVQEPGRPQATAARVLELRRKATDELANAQSRLVKAVRADVDAQLDIEAASHRSAAAEREKTRILQEQAKAKASGNVFGNLSFEAGSDKGAGRKSPLFEIIKREGEQAAALKETNIVTSEYDRINIELAKNLKGLKDTYEEATQQSKKLTTARRSEIDADNVKAEAFIRANAATQTNQLIAKQQYEYTVQRIEATYKETQATIELAQARFQAAKESERQIKLKDSAYSFQQSMKYQLPAVQAAEKAKFDVRVAYDEKLRQMDIESNKRLSEMMYTADGELKANVNLAPELEASKAAKSTLKVEAVTETAKASAQAYQAAWDQTIGQISSDFTSQMLNGTLKVKDFMVDTFAKTVLQPRLNILMQQGFDALLGSAGGWFSNLMGMGSAIATGNPAAAIGSDLLTTNSLTADMFAGGKLRSYAGGGSTGNGPRSGGLDGQGGYLAMLHPKETVTDHTVAGNGNSAPVYVTITNTVGDVATKSMLDQYNAATVKQIQAGIGRSMRYNGAMGRG